MSVDVAPRTERRARPQGRLPVVVVVAAVLVVAAVVAGGLGVHRWTHPRLFAAYAGEVSTHPLAVADAATSFLVTFPRPGETPETVTLGRTGVRWSTDTAQATATLWICRRQSGEGLIGAVHDPRADCRDLVRATPGQQLRWGGDLAHDYLFVTITPTRPGVARLTGVDVTYRRGAGHLFQHGTQTIGAALTVTAR